MKKGKAFTIIMSIISLLLIIGAIVGTVALVRNINDVFKEEPAVTEKPGDTNAGNDTNTGGNTNTGTDTMAKPATMKIDEVNQTGYATVSGVTYFFKIINKSSTESYFTVLYKNIQPYSSYLTYKTCSSCGQNLPKLYVSWDLTSWQMPSYEYCNGGNSYFEGNCNTPIYVAYCFISGCTNPDLVLEDLNQNVFSNESMFKYNLVNAFG